MPGLRCGDGGDAGKASARVQPLDEERLVTEMQLTEFVVLM
jgi:hypothetical protein